MKAIREEIKAMWIICLGGVYKKKLDQKDVKDVAKLNVLNLFDNYESEQIPNIIDEMRNQLVKYIDEDILVKQEQFKKAVALRETIANKLQV